MPLAISVVPSIGSTATSHSGPLAVADLLAVEQHGRVVLLALADHDDAAHGDGVDQLAHRVDRGAVAAVLVAPADPAPAAIAAASVTRTSSIARLRSGASRRRSAAVAPFPDVVISGSSLLDRRHAGPRSPPARTACDPPRRTRPTVPMEGQATYRRARNERTGAPHCHDGGVSPDPDPASRPAATRPHGRSRRPRPSRPRPPPRRRRPGRPCSSRHWSSRRGRR